MKGNQECPVLKHNQEPTENQGGRRRGSRKDKELVRDDLGQNQNMALDGDGKGKSIGDGKQRKLSPLRLSISNNQARLCFYENGTQCVQCPPCLTLVPFIVCVVILYSLMEILTSIVHACSFV